MFYPEPDIIAAGFYTGMTGNATSAFSPERITEYYETEIQLSGGGTSVINGREYERKTGQIFFCRPGTTRKSSGRISCYFLYFAFPHKNTDFEEAFIAPLPDVFASSGSDKESRIVMEMAKAHHVGVPQLSAALYNSAKFYELLAVLHDDRHRSVKAPDKVLPASYLQHAERIKRAQSYLHSHLAEKINLKDLCAVCNMSEFYFQRVFKALVGETPSEYLLHLRLTHAEELLAGTDMTMDEIADKCGFGQPAYFQYVFKKHENSTPGAFRKSRRT
ncbi:MAG TPA: AraC family transcriptional regulator, partial [Armatimonadota bacterium]|nr:AraC family transcriptional regulator [Armatimonadota bacterium]